MSARVPTRARTWRIDDGGTLCVGVRVARPGRAAAACTIAAVTLGAAITFGILAPHTLGKWAFCAISAAIGLAALYGACFNALGWCELEFAPDALTLRQGVGPLTSTRRVAWADVRKSERVDRVDANAGRRLETVFYVFGPRRTWRFGECLTLAAADHLWRDLSARGRSSSRVERVVPTSD